MWEKNILDQILKQAEEEVGQDPSGGCSTNGNIGKKWVSMVRECPVAVN